MRVRGWGGEWRGREVGEETIIEFEVGFYDVRSYSFFFLFRYVIFFFVFGNGRVVGSGFVFCCLVLVRRMVDSINFRFIEIYLFVSLRGRKRVVGVG